MKFEFPFRGETETLNENTRAALPGQFVELPLGVTHYELGGPDDGAPVILVHGYSVPYFIWDPTYEALTAAGFRVLRYDLYGRGYSDRPHTTYNHDLFDQQLMDLLDALNFNQPVNLIGLSMGGLIAATFTTRHPERVEKLTLIDPVGFPIDLSLSLKLIKIPGIGELLFNFFGSKTLVEDVANDFFDLEQVELGYYIEKYSVSMRYRGFLRAMLSTLRANTPFDDLGAYQKVGQSGHPTLLFWGREDRAIPFIHSNTLRKIIPQLEFHPIDNTGHIPHYERPEIVNPILLEFLQK